jgi:Leucine-rich repeat (LRR) protein
MCCCDVDGRSDDGELVVPCPKPHGPVHEGPIKTSFRILNVIKNANEQWRNSRDDETRKRTKFDVSGNVVELYLVNCGIDIVPTELAQFSYLERLWLSGNMISVLPDELRFLRRLEAIWLSNNALARVPQLPVSLKILCLDTNRIATFVGAERLTNLVELDMSGNLLVEVPDVIGALRNLQKLDFHDNRISTVSPKIGSLASLQRLSLHSNSIEELPEEIGELRRLTYLTLHHNEMRALPGSFGKLTSLIRLSAHVNDLEVLPDSFADCCNNIASLSLFGNRLREIQAPVFSNLVKCQKLALYNNRLAMLPNEVKCMVELETVWLYANDWIEGGISPELFKLPKLTEIFMDEKNMSS